MKCPNCEGNLTKVQDIMLDLDGYCFIIKGQRCSECAEEIIDEKEGQKMINTAKKLKLWGEPLKLHRKLSKSGRGTVLRIPTDIEQSMNLKGDENVLISRQGRNKIILEIKEDQA